VIRLGLVGVNTSHADAFSRIFNGDESKAGTIDGASIGAIWGSDPDRVTELANRHRIERVVGDPSDLLGQVDGVLVVDDTDGGAHHAALARPFIEAGLPVFIDKPMTTDYAGAVALFDLASRTGAPLLSCSALRFASELPAAREEIARIGELSSVVSVGPGDWYYYGVHAVELLGAIVGTGARSVHRHEFEQRDVSVIPYANGPVAVVETLRDAAYVFELTAYGQDGHTSFTVSDHAGFYTNTMREVARMVETGVSPLTPEDTLEVLAILQAGVQSAAARHTVPVAGAGR
jgi:predicted dehydrogenase